LIFLFVCLCLILSLMDDQNIKRPEYTANHSQPRSPVFDHERLQVYNLQLEFIRWVTPLIEEAARSATGRPREVCDQLDRASISSVLNTAEGNGKRQRPVRAKFFDDARGSATECAGCLDVLVAKGVVPPDRVMAGKGMLLQIVCMMSGLVDRFDQHGSGRLHEQVVDYGTHRDYVRIRSVGQGERASGDRVRYRLGTRNPRKQGKMRRQTKRQSQT